LAAAAAAVEVSCYGNLLRRT